LETLAYVLIYMAVGVLPWQGGEGNSKRERAKRMLEHKLQAALLECHVRERLGGDAAGEALAEALVGLSAACRGLEAAVQPDYEGLLEILAHGLPPSAQQGDLDAPTHRLDWLAL